MDLSSRAGVSSSKRPTKFTPLITSPADAAPVPAANLRRNCDKSRSLFLRSSNNCATRSASWSGVIFNRSAALDKIWSRDSIHSSAPDCVTASIRRTPPATADSDTIFNKAISPVRVTCVPPHNSTDQALSLPFSAGPPICTTRTSSPYFSPNSASAPSLMAASGVIIRVETSLFIRMRSFTIDCTCASSAVLTAFGCEKSNRNLSAETIDPFCATWSPRTWRNASCNKCVAE